MGGQDLADYGVHWDARRGRGEGLWAPSYTPAARQTDRQTDRQYTILERARGRPDQPGQIGSDPSRPDQTRPDQTDRLRHAHVCFVFGTERAGDACCPVPKLRWLQKPRDLSRFVRLFRQDGRRRAGRAWSRAMRLACPHRARRWLRLVTMVTHMCYARGGCCVCDLACVGSVAVQPDALMSTQPSFQRCSRPRKKVCPPTSLAFGCAAVAAAACLACDESGNGCGAGDPQGCPGATPRFWSLFGNRVDGKWTPRSWGLAVVRDGRIFSFGFGHFLALPSAPFYYIHRLALCCSLTRQATQGHRPGRLPVSSLKNQGALDT